MRTTMLVFLALVVAAAGTGLRGMASTQDVAFTDIAAQAGVVAETVKGMSAGKAKSVLMGAVESAQIALDNAMSVQGDAAKAVVAEWAEAAQDLAESIDTIPNRAAKDILASIAESAAVLGYKGGEERTQDVMSLIESSSQDGDASGAHLAKYILLQLARSSKGLVDGAKSSVRYPAARGVLKDGAKSAKDLVESVSAMPAHMAQDILSAMAKSVTSFMDDNEDERNLAMLEGPPKKATGRWRKDSVIGQIKSVPGALVNRALNLRGGTSWTPLNVCFRKAPTNPLYATIEGMYFPIDRLWKQIQDLPPAEYDALFKGAPGGAKPPLEDMIVALTALPGDILNCALNRFVGSAFFKSADRDSPWAAK